MLKPDLVRLRHALDAAKKAVGFVEDRLRDDLYQDEMLALALVRLLEIVGEAAGCVSDEFKARHTHVPWREMKSLRNRLIHGYFDINLDIVWSTVTGDLPPVIKMIVDILELEADD